MTLAAPFPHEFQGCTLPGCPKRDKDPMGTEPDARRVCPWLWHSMTQVLHHPLSHHWVLLPRSTPWVSWHIEAYLAALLTQAARASSSWRRSQTPAPALLHQSSPITAPELLPVPWQCHHPGVVTPGPGCHCMAKPLAPFLFPLPGANLSQGHGLEARDLPQARLHKQRPSALPLAFTSTRLKSPK